MRPSLHAAIAIAVALAVVPAAARAQNASEQAEARTLFDQGSRLYASGDFAAACPKLEASLHLYAGLGTRGRLAECYEKLGRTASAWAMYEQVAILAAKAGDAPKEQVARERSAALGPKLARLTVVLPPASDVPGLVVKRGGETVERGAMGSAVPVDPGTLGFEVAAPGRVTKTLDVKVAPSQQVTFEVPALDVAPPPPPGTVPEASPAGPDGTAAAGATGGTASADAGSHPTWQTPTAIALGGAGVVAIGVGAVLALTAKGSYDAAFSHGDCSHATLTCDGAGQSQTDGARSRANVGGALLGVGAVFVVGGGVLFFTAPHAAPAAALRVAPALAPGVAGLSVAGGF
jgi:hypothetical protein